MAEPCKTAGSNAAQPVADLPDAAGADFYRAMSAATQPETVAAALKALDESCTRSDRLYGENGDRFPRILKVPGKPAADIAFFAPLTFKRGGKAVTMYAVVKSFGSGAVLLSGLLDAIPPDDKTTKILLQTYDGGFEPLEFDAKTGQLVDKNNYVPTQLRRAAAEIPH